MSIPVYTLGGKVPDLRGTGLLHNDGNGGKLRVGPSGAAGADVSFTSANSLATGTKYSIPASPLANGQSCKVTSGATGTVGMVNIGDIVVACTGYYTVTK